MAAEPFTGFHVSSRLCGACREWRRGVLKVVAGGGGGRRRYVDDAGVTIAAGRKRARARESRDEDACRRGRKPAKPARTRARALYVRRQPPAFFPASSFPAARLAAVVGLGAVVRACVSWARLPPGSGAPRRSLPAPGGHHMLCFYLRPAEPGSSLLFPVLCFTASTLRCPPPSS